MGNNALVVNNGIGGSPQIAITSHGSDAYWAITAVMALATITFIGLAFTKPRQNRIFHYITAAITLTAAIAYFSMASGLGQTPIVVEFPRGAETVRGRTREIFYVRYIDWFITTPLLLMDLLLTAGMPWPTILYTIFLNEVMVVTGLVGALTQTNYKWGYYVFGCAAFVGVAWTLIFPARKHAQALGSDIHKTYIIVGVWTTFLWCLYPIAWGLCEGGNVIAPDSEAAFYGALDVLAKPGFGALLLWGHRNIDPARLGLRIRDYENEQADYKKNDEKTRYRAEGMTSDNVNNGETIYAPNGDTEAVPVTNRTAGPAGAT